MPNTVRKKLKYAFSTGQTAYVTGGTGFGKTEFVRQFLIGKNYTYISCDNLSLKRNIEKNCENIVVIDNLHLLSDDEQKQQIISLSKNKSIQLVLINRSSVPSWLMPAYIFSGFIIINENDLGMTHRELKILLEKSDLKLSDNTINSIIEQSCGNILIINHILTCLEQGFEYTDQLVNSISENFCDYLINSVMSQWDNDVVEFLMQISCVDEFCLQLAEFVTGNQYVSSILQKAKETGNFISEENGVYKIRSIMLKALRILSAQTYSSAQLKEFIYNAGLYYETQDNIVKALEMYEKSGNTGRIKELLIRNSRRNPGNGHFLELRKSYFSLPEEEIEKSPILMAGMSMLYSMLMQINESKYWYDKLKYYEKNAKGGDKREALSRLTYLEIALPYKKSKDLLKIIKGIPIVLFDKGIKIQEFSVTSNVPSTMNGGLDFCSWSKKDKEIAKAVGGIVERLCGRYGKGIVSAALGESGYEKGEDAYEVLSYLSQAQIEAENGGKLEIAFAAVGIQTRLSLCNANTESALNILTSFEQKVLDNGDIQLMPNLNAMKCRLALYNDENGTVDKWLEEAPDEIKEFFTIERYRYLTKIRCYIAKGKYFEAYSLIEKMHYYAELYCRTYILIELSVLSAIVKYRMGNTWKSDFIYALETASDYHFIPIISEEGAAVTCLLNEIKKDIGTNNKIDKEWFREVEIQSNKMAKKYPLYLRPKTAEKSDFSQTALEILRLQANGFTTSKIAGKLGIKIDTVKYHIKQNYKKLDVSSKTDAVIIAQQFNII